MQRVIVGFTHAIQVNKRPNVSWFLPSEPFRGRPVCEKRSATSEVAGASNVGIETAYVDVIRV